MHDPGASKQSSFSDPFELIQRQCCRSVPRVLQPERQNRGREPVLPCQLQNVLAHVQHRPSNHPNRNPRILQDRAGHTKVANMLMVSKQGLEQFRADVWMRQQPAQQWVIPMDLLEYLEFHHPSRSVLKPPVDSEAVDCEVVQPVELASGLLPAGVDGLEQPSRRGRVAQEKQILLANSGCWSQLHEFGHPSLSSRHTIQPVHNTQNVHTHHDTNFL